MNKTLWRLACEDDGIDPDSKFVMFTDDNPYTHSELSLRDKKLLNRHNKIDKEQIEKMEKEAEHLLGKIAKLKGETLTLRRNIELRDCLIRRGRNDFL